MHKPIKRLLIVTSCCILLTACQSKEEQAPKISLKAEQLYQSGDADGALSKYIKANEIFEKPEYQEIIQHIKDESEYNIAKEKMIFGNIKGAIKTLEKIPDFMGSKELLNQCYYKLARQSISLEKYSEAVDLLEMAGDFGDTAELLHYVKSILEYQTGDLETARAMFESLSGYADSDQYLKNIAAFESLQGEWLSHQYMWDGEMVSYGDQGLSPDVVIIGRDVSTIHYTSLEKTEVSSVFNWRLDYVDDDGLVVVNNQYGQAGFYYSINEDGELVESSIYKFDKYHTYTWLGDSSSVPDAQEDPTIGSTP